MYFLRCEQYMKYCSDTARQLIFYDHVGREVRVVHAFPFRSRRAMEWFKNHDIKPFKQVRPPEGWRVYALKWDETNRFVVNKGERGCQYDDPPHVERFDTRVHGGTFESVSHRSLQSMLDLYDSGYDDGDMAWIDEVVVRYQVVFSPVPIKFVRGRPTKGWLRRRNEVEKRCA